MDSFEKGKLGEEYVSKLVKEKFISYWCYPNPLDQKGDKKEICDLLILFKNIAIIISIKSYFLKGNYDRYKKKVITKSTNQLYGAERKLFKNNRNIFIQHPETGTIEIDPAQFSEIFLLTINTGEQFEQYELFDSLPGKRHVSVINKDTLNIILQELDTIADLTEYLIKREQLLKKENININGTEKDLLGVFLRNARTFPENFMQNNVRLNIQGEWDIYDQNAKVTLKRFENRSSYFIDKIVKKDILKIENGHYLAVELMSLSRLERRMIAKSWFDLIFINSEKENFLARRYIPNSPIPILLLYYHTNSEENKDIILQQTALIYQFQNKEPKIIMLAATKNMNEYKFGFFKRDIPYSVEEIENYKQTISQSGWFTNEVRIKINEQEYPAT